jgi:hypothetical protein
MARVERFRFSHAQDRQRVSSRAPLPDAKVILNNGKGPNGRYVTVDGEQLLNFGSCSYAGLEACETTEARIRPSARAGRSSISPAHTSSARFTKARFAARTDLGARCSSRPPASHT